LRSLHDLIKDAPDAADAPDQTDPMRVEATDPKASSDFPTLTNVVHDSDDVQRDLFEQIAFGNGALPNEAKINAPDSDANNPAKDTIAPESTPVTARDETITRAPRDFAADADRFAEENFPKSPDAPDAADSAIDDALPPDHETLEHDDIPQLAGAAAVAASRAVAARGHDDGIPVVTSAIDADAEFPDGVFAGPELDDYPGDTLPGGFLPGSVDNRPYDEFGIDELPGEDEAPGEFAAEKERATIWDDHRPGGFVQIDDEPANTGTPLVKNTLTADGERPLNPAIANEIHDALAGLLGKWPESDADATAVDSDNLDAPAPPG